MESHHLPKLHDWKAHSSTHLLGYSESQRTLCVTVRTAVVINWVAYFSFTLRFDASSLVLISIL